MFCLAVASVKQSGNALMQRVLLMSSQRTHLLLIAGKEVLARERTVVYI